MMMLFIALFARGAFLVMAHAKEDPTPPIWPDGYSVEFIETLNSSSTPYSTRNTGRWFYDWTAKRSRFDHDFGQRNDFCQLALGMSPADEKAPSCRLYFTEKLEMWVAYPEQKDCCSLCWPNPHGFPAVCGSMRPDWLVHDSIYHGQVSIAGNSCSWWSKHGAVADDNWYVRADGVPCAYREHYRTSGANIDNITDHEIRFNASSYVVGRPSSHVFELPQYCNRNCTFHPGLFNAHSGIEFLAAQSIVKFSTITSVLV